MTLSINKKQKPKILTDFLNYLQVIKGYSKKTIEGYNSDLLLFFNFIKKYQRIETDVQHFNIFILLKVTTSDVIAFLVYLNFSMDNSPYTRQKKLSAIRRFYKWLIGLYPNMLQKNPAENIQNITKMKRLPKHLSLEQAKKVQNIFTIENSKYPIRNNTIISLFLSSGMRLSELININIEDVDIENNSIKIIGKGNKERTVYFSNSCKIKLQKYLDFRSRKNKIMDINSPLFINNHGNRIGQDGIEYICKKAYKLAGLQEYGYNVHALRHTAATLMYQYANVDTRTLQVFLGHKSIKTTEIYTHIYNGKLKEAMDNHPLNNNKKIA